MKLAILYIIVPSPLLPLLPSILSFPSLFPSDPFPVSFSFFLLCLSSLPSHLFSFLVRFSFLSSFLLSHFPFPSFLPNLFGAKMRREVESPNYSRYNRRRYLGNRGEEMNGLVGGLVSFVALVGVG